MRHKWKGSTAKLNCNGCVDMVGCTIPKSLCVINRGEDGQISGEFKRGFKLKNRAAGGLSFEGGGNGQNR